MGMGRQETLCTRIGEMNDLIACMAIYNGAVQPAAKKRKMTFDECMAYV